MSDPNPDGKKSANHGTGGRFAMGNKASPGRPPGRGAVAEMRLTLATDLDKIIETLRAQALAGDLQAIRILLDRVLPSLRPVELPTVLNLPVQKQDQLAYGARSSREISPSRRSMKKNIKCGAHARSTGQPCQAKALANGRCNLHGGASTGPRTPEGRAAVAEATRQRMASGQRIRALEGFYAWLRAR